MYNEDEVLFLKTMNSVIKVRLLPASTRDFA